MTGADAWIAVKLRATRRRLAPTSRLRAFAGDVRGATAVVFTLALAPAMLLASMAIDYSASVAFQDRVQAALDTAVLAGANSSNPGTTPDERIAVAKKTFAAAVVRDGAAIKSVSFTVDADTRIVRGEVRAVKTSVFGGPFAPPLTMKLAAAAAPTAAQVRALDVVLCVDATGSMWNTLWAVQDNAASFKSSLDAAIGAAGSRPFDQTRVRVIYFRDFGGFGYLNQFGRHSGGTGLGDDPALIASGFFNLASQTGAFSRFVYGQDAAGGGDLPESGLECLNEAMQSAWTKVGDQIVGAGKATQVYPVISIYTDAGAHPPNFSWSVQNPNYPGAMPRDFAGLLARWTDPATIDQSHKAILFFGDPAIQDDYYTGHRSAWTTVATWPGFSNPGSLTTANAAFIATLARGIVGSGAIRLTD